MAMDSIKFRSVHLMDDGDGHHIFCIDGDGDGHHFKGDGRHVWCGLMFSKLTFYTLDYKGLVGPKNSNLFHSLLCFSFFGFHTVHNWNLATETNI